MHNITPDIRSIRPNPWLFGLDTLWHIRKNALNYYADIQKRYGDAVPVRLGPHRCWFLFHPDYIEQTLAKQAAQTVRFERLMNILRQWNGKSLLIAEGNSWKERRRKVMPAFKQQRMPAYAKMVTQHTEALRNRWVNESVGGIFTCDIDREMASHALDIAGITLFGRQIGSQSEEVSHAVHSLSEIAYHEATTPFAPPVWLPLPKQQEKRRVILLMKRTIHDIVAARLDTKTEDQSDLLSMLVMHHEGESQAIEEDVMSLLIAGHETSGATLTWLFLLLARHPESLQQVQKEIDRVVGPSSIQYEQLPQLPYIHACLQETMRLYPAAYALFCRRAIKDINLGKVTIRSGELIQLIPYITHRDPRWFSEPETFRPERFLDKEPLWPSYAYIPFGAGPRVCIGQTFGMMEIILTAVILLQQLEPEPINALPFPSPRFSLRPDRDITIKWKNRSNRAV